MSPRRKGIYSRGAVRQSITDPKVLHSIEALKNEAVAIQVELERVRATREPYRAGVGVFAKFVIPSGYKRLARQVGSVWMDSSYQSQMKRLDGVGDAWRQRVLEILGSTRVLPSEGRRGLSPRRLKAAFNKTQRYARLDSRLRNGAAFLDDLGQRDAVSAEHTARARVPIPTGISAMREAAPLPERKEAMQAVFPASVVELLPDPVRRSILQAEESYQRGMYEPAAVMLRKAVQNAVVLRFEAEGVVDQVLLASGDALPFPKLLEKAQRSRLISSQQAKELMRVKWLGDTAAHSYSNVITKEDIDGVLVIARLALERIFTIRIRASSEASDAQD